MTLIEQLCKLADMGYTKADIDEMLNNEKSATAVAPLSVEKQEEPKEVKQEVKQEVKEDVKEDVNEVAKAQVERSNSETITLTKEELRNLLQSGATKGVEGTIETPPNVDDALANFYKTI